MQRQVYASTLRRDAICVHRPYGVPLITPLRGAIVDCLLGGMTQAQAVSAIGVSAKTIETHLERMRRRTGCATTAQLLAAVAVAAERGETWMWGASA